MRYRTLLVALGIAVCAFSAPSIAAAADNWYWSEYKASSRLTRDANRLALENGDDGVYVVLCYGKGPIYRGLYKRFVCRMSGLNGSLRFTIKITGKNSYLVTSGGVPLGRAATIAT